MILAIIGKIGVGGGTGHVIEYRGSGDRALSMEERMTVCNMSIEAGARAGMVAPDETTFEYLQGRPLAPQGADVGRAPSRAGARCRPTPARRFDREVDIDVAKLGRWSRTARIPAWSCRSTATVPDQHDDPAFRKALAYMGSRPASRCSASRSTSCSSASARTAA